MGAASVIRGSSHARGGSTRDVGLAHLTASSPGPRAAPPAHPMRRVPVANRAKIVRHFVHTCREKHSACPDSAPIWMRPSRGSRSADATSIRVIMTPSRRCTGPRTPC